MTFCAENDSVPLFQPVGRNPSCATNLNDAKKQNSSLALSRGTKRARMHGWHALVCHTWIAALALIIYKRTTGTMFQYGSYLLICDYFGGDLVEPPRA